ncbi:MAG TPA: hypothetical protein VJ965_00400, partial [Anaerolineales bacterium]|nr:hypothetical protein [Anaerolineales bacterium]
THFSEYGITLEELAELGDLVSDVEIAVAENIMARGTPEQKLAALDRWTELLLNDGNNEITIQTWTPWTSSIMSLILYMNHMVRIYEWNSDTPGFTEMITKMQNLIDLWFEKSGEVIQDIEEKCIDGEIDYWGRGTVVIKAGEGLVSQLTLEGREDQLGRWSGKVSTCQQVGMTWQANIVAKKTDEFESDISVGSEAEAFGYDVGIIQEELEVEFIEGFWGDICLPTSGKVDLSYKIEYEFENLGLLFTSVVQDITAWVKITEPVYIDCLPLGGFELDADAQAPFHGAAMDRLNEDRMSGDDAYSEFWEFELNYDPGGGIIAQFEEGPKTLNVPELTYELWQLLTLYQSTFQTTPVE